jgi:hypothetical protein
MWLCQHQPSGKLASLQQQQQQEVWLQVLCQQQHA